MNPKLKPTDFSNQGPLSPQDLERLLELLKSIKYGSVTVVIQDGHVVQIDRNEKLRLK